MANVIRELVVKVGVEADTKGFDQLDDAQEKSTTGSAALGTALGVLAADLVKVGLSAAKAGAAMIVDLVFGTAEAGDEIIKTAQKLGIGTDALQKLRGAAELSGAATSDLDAGIKDLTKNLGESIEKGAGPATEALKTLDLEVAELDSLLATGDIEAALGLIGDAANKLNDPVREQAALMKLLGGAGTALRPLLEAGTEGINEMTAAIEKTGSVIDNEGLVSFAAMQDSLLLAEKRFDGVKNQIAVGLAPVITDIATKVGEFVDENKDFIEQDLPRIMEDVGEALLTTSEFLFDLLVSWKEFIRDTVSMIELLEESLGPALEDLGEQFGGLDAFISGVGLAILDMTESFLEAVGAGNELLQVLIEIKKAVQGDDQGPQGTRGAAAVQHATAEGVLIGKPGHSVQNSDLAAAESSGDTTKLRAVADDPKFSDSDRARFSAKADSIDLDNAAKAEKAAADKAAKRSGDIQRSRDRAKSAQRANRKGGGGGGGAKPAAAEASVDDLLAGAIGAATGGGPAKVGGSALAGTMLITVDQSISITHGNVTIALDVPASVIADGSPGDLAEVVRSEFESLLEARNRVTFDFFEGRRAVGAG